MNNETKHTLWKSRSAGNVGKFFIEDHGGNVIAELPPQTSETERELIAAAPETAAERDRLREANAELLEALTLAEATINRLSTNHGPFNSSQGTLDVIRAAIAKAEGQEEKK